MVKFFVCEICGNVVELINDHGAPLSCCGTNMVFLTPNTVEASQEKHLPQVSRAEDGLKVKVGSVLHPMGNEHYIDFIYVKSAKGFQRVKLEIEGSPEAQFCCVGDGPVEVYAYCNLHGMWKTELK